MVDLRRSRMAWALQLQDGLLSARVSTRSILRTCLTQWSGPSMHVHGTDSLPSAAYGILVVRS
jgi:hypothetical protein